MSWWKSLMIMTPHIYIFFKSRAHMRNQIYTRIFYLSHKRTGFGNLRIRERNDDSRESSMAKIINIFSILYTAACVSTILSAYNKKVLFFFTISHSGCAHTHTRKSQSSLARARANCGR